jgi:hypothetical protein
VLKSVPAGVAHRPLDGFYALVEPEPELGFHRVREGNDQVLALPAVGGILIVVDHSGAGVRGPNCRTTFAFSISPSFG